MSNIIVPNKLKRGEVALPSDFKMDKLMEYQVTPPKTPSELWHYVKNVFGVEIPTAAVCKDKGHCSMFAAFCIAEGSKVTTKYGDTLIENLLPGDEVITRKGWNPVEHVTFVGHKATIKLHLSNGNTLICTPEHHIATLSGWVTASNLFTGDFLIGSPLPACNISTKSAESIAELVCTSAVSDKQMSSEANQIVEQMALSGMAPNPGFVHNGALSNIQAGSAHARPIPLLDNLATNTFSHTVEIIQREEGPILPVWDVGVKNCNEFLCEGVIVHNSAAYFAEHPLIVFKASRGSGKCMKSSEKVLFPRGGMLTWKDAQLAGTLDVYSPELTGTGITKAYFEDNGNQECISIELESGTIITRTKEHPLMTAEIYKKNRQVYIKNPKFVNAENITKGHVILVANSMPSYSHVDIDDEGISILGLLLGDGSTSYTSAISFTSGSEITHLEFKRCIEHYGGKVNKNGSNKYRGYVRYGLGKGRCRYKETTALWKLLESFGILGYKADTKKFPDWVWKLSDKQLALLMNRLWSTDGYIQCSGPGSAGKGDKVKKNLVFEVTSKQLRDDLALAMHRLGIPGFSRYSGKGSYKLPDGSYKICLDVYRWEPYPGFEKKFFEVLEPVLGKEEMCEFFLNYANTKKEGQLWRKSHTIDGYHWQAVKGITTEHCHTTSIHVPGSNQFCSPVVEHNSHLLALLALTEIVALGTFAVILGGSGVQSKRVHDYINSKDPAAKGKFWEAPGAPAWLKTGEPTADKTNLIHGGKLVALMASEASVRGLHPARLRLDECCEKNSSCKFYDKTKKIWTTKRICDILPGEEVLSWNGNEFVPGLVTAAECKGIRPTFELKLSNGETLIATDNHPLYTNQGWKTINEIMTEKEGTYLLYGVQDADEVGSSQEVILYGSVLGVHSKEKGFRCLEMSRLWGEAKNKKLHPSIRRGKNSPKMQRVLQTISLCTEKVLPNLWKSYCEKFQHLQCLLSQIQSGEKISLHELRSSCSGKFSPLPSVLYSTSRFRRISGKAGGGVRKQSTQKIYIGSNISMGRCVRCVSKTIYKGLPAASSIGKVHSRLCGLFSGKGSYRDSITTIQNNDEDQRFSKQEKNYVCSTGISARGVCRIKNTNAKMGSNVTENFQRGKYFDILSITKGDEVEVWDLTVAEYHNFIAENILVHNCDVMDLKIYKSSLGMPKALEDVSCQTVACSTRQNPRGTMWHIEKEAKAKGHPMMTWCYKETMTPHGWATPESIADLRATMGDDTWEKEMEHGEPVVGGLVWDALLINEIFDPEFGIFEGELHEYCVTPGEEEPRAGYEYYHGVDLASKLDFTIIASFRKPINGEGPDVCIAWERTGRLEWGYICYRVDERIKTYGGVAYYDATGVGQVAGEMFTTVLEPWDFNKKRESIVMLENYVQALKTRKIKYPLIEWAKNEHKGTTFDELFGGRHLSDAVCAGALAWQAREFTGDIILGRAW